MAKRKKKAPTKITQKQILKMERASRRIAQMEAGIKIIHKVHKSDKTYTRKGKKPPEAEE